jgi:hypothetical protein
MVELEVTCKKLRYNVFDVIMQEFIIANTDFFKLNAGNVFYNINLEATEVNYFNYNSRHRLNEI